MCSITRLKDAGAIYFENIQFGFDNYDYRITQLNEEEAYETIKELWKSNGHDNSYADFYYYKIDEAAREKVERVLNKKEKQYLKDMSHKDEIIFHLDDTLLRILIKLNYLEVLFSTFYFTREPCTLWGNYNQEYIIFREKHNIRLVYKRNE